MSDLDYGAEDWQFPNASDMDVVQAGQLWDAIEREARAANRRADLLKARKAQAKALALEVIDASGQTSARVPVADGREVNLTPYTWEVFSVKDEVEFKAWADTAVEDFYDRSPKLREQVFLDEMRRRSQDGEPLPPGVVRWEDTRISRTTAAPRRRK